MRMVMQGDLCDGLFEDRRILVSLVLSVFLKRHLCHLVFILGGTVDDRILGANAAMVGLAGAIRSGVPVRVYAAGPATERRPQDILHGGNTRTDLESQSVAEIIRGSRLP